MLPTRLALACLAFSTMAVGCTSLRDGGDRAPYDAGRRDAGARDAALEPADAAGSDAAGEADAESSEVDAGIVDAGEPDAGGVVTFQCPGISTGASPFRGRIFAATSYSSGVGNIYELRPRALPSMFATVFADDWLGPILITPEGRMLAATNENGGTIRDITEGGAFMSTRGLLASHLFADLGYVEGLAVDGSGRMYITNSENGAQPLVTVTAAGVVARLPRTYSNATCVLACGDFLLISEAGTGEIWKHDIATDAESLWASGFRPGQRYISAQMVIDHRGHLLVLWSALRGNPGLFDVTGGGDFIQASPLVEVSGFDLSVNQLAVDAEDDVFVAGGSSGAVFVSRFDGTSHAPFERFATGLDYTDSIAIGPN